MKKATSIQEYPIPQSDGLEIQIIADIIAQPDIFAEAERTISHDMFDNNLCRSAWMTLKKMMREGLKIDLPSAYSRLDKSLMQGVIKMMGNASGATTALQHFGELKDMHIKRKCYFAAMDFLSWSSSPNVRADEIISEADNLARNLRKEIDAEKGTQHISTVLNDLADNISQIKVDNASGTAPRVRTGFKTLDFLTYGGFNRGNLVILAARPSVGKTAVMLQMALAAARSGKKVNLFNLEMKNTELAQRMLFSSGKVTPLQMARGDVEWSDYEVAAGEYANKPMYLNDTARTLEEIKARIVLNKQARKCDIAFIDYLGLIKKNPRLNTAQAIEEITNELKHTAKDCGIPIVLLCQLNRMSASEKRPPEMHDLRDSGAIEQDADIILMLERSGEDEEGREINIWVRKNRGGRAGNVKIEVEANETYTVFTEKEDDVPHFASAVHLNPIEAIQEEIHRVTRSPFEEHDFNNQEFPF